MSGQDHHGITIGNKKNYFIKEGYIERLDNAAFDDTPCTDEYQKEVYEIARRVADETACKTILDIGCGSGYKLVTNFPADEFFTVGTDLPDTVDWLKMKYPDRTWMLSDFASRLTNFDLVICADVIEHLPDPDSLLSYIQSVAPRWIVLSTPDRDILGQRYGTSDGPPRNIHHVREWNMPEFRAYISFFFRIVEQLYVSEQNATQLVLCESKTTDSR